MKHILLLVILSVLAVGLAAEIHSTSLGGDWNDINTWVGGIIPGQADDVVINGPVAPDTMSYCHDLSLSGTGFLTHSYAIPLLNGALSVSGDLNNGGRVEKRSNGSIVLHCYGSIVNNGILKPDHLYLAGSADQYLFNGGTFLPAVVTDQNEYSALILWSDLTTNGDTTINMNGGHLVLNGTLVRHLSMTGGTIQNTVLEGGNGATFTGAGDVWFSGVTCNELILNGTVLFTNSSSFGTLVNNGTISTQLYTAGNLAVSQNLTNFGVITRGGGGTLNLSLGGDFYEHGSCYANRIDFIAPGPHHVWQSGAANPISGTYVYSSTAAGDICMLSDLRFYLCAVDLGGGTLAMHDGDSGYDLNFLGGYLISGTLEGNSSSSLTMSDNASVQGITADILATNGTVLINQTNTFGQLANNGTLSTLQYSTGNLTVTERLDNYGSITRGGGGTMNLSLGGDYYHHINGTLAPNRCDFVNPGPHNLWQDENSGSLGTTGIYSSSTAGICQMLSDLRFNHCACDLGGGTLVMHDGASGYDLNFNGGYLKTGTLSGNSSSSVTMNDNAWLQGITADNLATLGTVVIDQASTIGHLANHGTLLTPVYSPGNLTVTQRLDNFGTIRNGGGPGGNFTLNLGGDLYNYGSMFDGDWSSSNMYVNGTSDQHIRNAGSINWSGRFWLVSELGDSQWYFNGSLYASNYVTNYCVNPSILGIWQPYLEPVTGRQIIIGNGTTLITPQNVTLEQDSGVLSLSWEQVPDALFYTVYASSTPNGSFTVLHRYVFDTDLSDGLVTRDIDPAEQARFLRVTATN